MLEMNGCIVGCICIEFSIVWNVGMVFFMRGEWKVCEVIRWCCVMVDVSCVLSVLMFVVVFVIM